MLKNSNLQFTNATKFNDPFDCHPALFEYLNVPESKRVWPGTDFVSAMAKNRMENLRNGTWISCFSKVYDSLLMWSYYNGHKGICIGLNKDAVISSSHFKYFGLVYPYFEEVKYKDMLSKLDYFTDHSSWTDLLTIKAKDWEHEQEIRLIAREPEWVNEKCTIPDELKEEVQIDWKEKIYRIPITSNCFESIHLGVNIYPRNEKKIIDAAKKLNPNIKIHKMELDPEAFRLKEGIKEY